MKIKFNNQFVELEVDAKLTDFLQSVNMLTATGLAVAVNQKVISKSNWGNHSLTENDEIMIIKATQGG